MSQPRHCIFREAELWLYIAEQRVQSESRKTWRKRTSSSTRYLSMNVPLGDEGSQEGVLRRIYISCAAATLIYLTKECVCGLKAIQYVIP